MIDCVVCVPSLDSSERSLYAVVPYPRVPVKGDYVTVPGFKNFNYQVIKVCLRPGTTALVTLEYGNIMGDIFPLLKRQPSIWSEIIPE